MKGFIFSFLLPFVLVFLIWNNLLHAQTTISKRVNNMPGQPLPEASAMLSNTMIGVMLDYTTGITNRRSFYNKGAAR